MTRDDAGASDVAPMPKVTLEAAPKYLIGFPVVVAITYANDLKDTEFYRLPELDLASVSWGIGLELEPVKGGAPYHLPPGHSETEVIPGVGLRHGEQRRMLFDLTNFGIFLPPGSPHGPHVAPGTYRMAVVISAGGHDTTTSNPVVVEVAEPSAADTTEAKRLRTLGGSTGFDNGAWAEFLGDNWTAVSTAPSLSHEAERQLALHLFLHRAYYGPEAIAHVDETLLGRVLDPSLAAEVAGYRYEIHAARSPAGAKHELDAVLARWPGMHAALVPSAEVEGRLPLARARHVLGMDGDVGQSHTPSPYKPKHP